MSLRISPNSKLLNVGCGQHYHPQWCNIELASSDPHVINCDVRRGLPFADNTFQAVYHSHLLEHLSVAAGEQFLYECLRVLQPGGVLRIVVPDLETIVSLYLEKLRRVNDANPTSVADYRWMTLELLDQMVRDHSGGLMGKYMTDPNIQNSEFVKSRLGSEFARLQTPSPHGGLGEDRRRRSPFAQRLSRAWSRFRLAIARTVVRWSLGRTQERCFLSSLFREQGEVHRWMYDRYSLREVCRRMGFVQFRICGPQVSSIENFSSYELDTVGDIVRKPDSLFVECRKPTRAAQAA